MIETTEQQDYDLALATALNLDTLIEKQNMSLQMTECINNMANEFKDDMVELGQKLKSATSKMSALLFLPSNLDNTTGASDQLQYSAILIEQPDALRFAPPSLPVAMTKGLEAETRKREDLKKRQEANRLQVDLKQQLAWFQEYGRNGILANLDMPNSNLTATTNSTTEKAKRHLTLITDTSQAA
ncbi:MAG: hypothetical protein WC714_06285 [Candidatus Obscuribacterales bacterium]|jgi:hypothetical protein